MKAYLEIISFDVKDVITTSGTPGSCTAVIVGGDCPEDGL